MNQQFIDDNFCDAEISRELKELGFNEPCFAFYVPIKGKSRYKLLSHPPDSKYNIEDFFHEELTAAPLYQQAKEYLLQHKINVKVEPTHSPDRPTGYFYAYYIHDNRGEDVPVVINDRAHETSAEAYTHALKSAISILKQQKPL